MLSLLIAILCSTMISLVMRFGEQRGTGQTGLLFVNYGVCFALAMVLALPELSSESHTGLDLALGLGSITGVFYLTSFLALQFSIRKNGVAVSTAFSKLSVLVPTLISILVFGEQPGFWVILGFVLALIAIIVMNTGSDSGQVTARPFLLVLLLVGGLGEVMSKIYNQLGASAWSSCFLMFTFLMALVLCGILCLFRHERIGKKELFYGVLLGIPNYFSAYFLLKSLQSIPATTAFPTYAVGVPALVTLAGLMIFHERLTKRQGIALGIIAAALVLLNL